MHHNTPEDYALVNSIIHDMFEQNRVRNYQFNHGEMMDALIKRSRELRETPREDYMKTFISGMIRGMEECAKIVYENSKEVAKIGFHYYPSYKVWIRIGGSISEKMTSDIKLGCHLRSVEDWKKEEFDLLWEAFDSCNETRRYQKQGEFMYGNKNRQEWGDPLRFNWSELDKSLKACEISAIDVSRRVEFNELYGKIYKFMGQMSDEYKRIRK